MFSVGAEQRWRSGKEQGLYMECEPQSVLEEHHRVDRQTVWPSGEGRDSGVFTGVLSPPSCVILGKLPNL